MSIIPPVSAVADVLALRGLRGWLTPPLLPVVGSSAPIVGRAVTVALRVDPNGRSSLNDLHRLLSTSLAGRIVVLASGPNDQALTEADGCVWGEILSRAAVRQGATAALVDAAVRDHAAMSAEGLPIYAAMRGVVGPAGRVAVASIGDDVEIGGHRVSSGDYIVADGDGVACVPHASYAAILADANDYAAAEDQLLASLAAGMPLAAAYAPKRLVVERIQGNN